jgi:hypothetical protein
MLCAVQADADLAGRIDWSMISVDSTSWDAYEHAAGARKKKPCLPKRGRRLGTTATTKGATNAATKSSGR